MRIPSRRPARPFSALLARATAETLESRRLLVNDFGDAPDSYGTTIAASGASHVITNNIVLGRHIDAEPDGHPSPNALRDDFTGVRDDEDGITFLGPIVPGATTNVQAELSASGGLLTAWIDFDRDGIFDNPSERILTSAPAPNGFSTHTFTTPAGITPGPTFARFRLTFAGVPTPGPTGPGEFGEVEDYQVNISGGSTTQPLDYGDAPDTYRTRIAVNGPRHLITNNIYLGTKIDSEPDGNPTALANGDDTLNLADEDGIVFLDPVTPGAVVRVSVTAAAGGGRLNGWLDFNRNGIFEPAVETIFGNAPVAGASAPNVITFVTPLSAVPGPTYSRFRLTASASAAGPWGADTFGEVEDYGLRILPAPQPKLDYGDVPDTYGTKLVSNGARHWVTPNLRLGNRIDAEPDGAPSIPASGDDLLALDDEDGITFLDPVIPGQPTRVQVVNGAGAGRLNAWLDFNLSGVFDTIPELIFSNVPLAAASTSILTFTTPIGATPGASYARFRLTAGASTVGAKGFGNFGEVEDYSIRIRERDGSEWDFGDAPTAATTPGYPTLLANNGARHVRVPQMPMLGGRWDAEPNGVPTLNARGDDLAGIDDEDGVRIGATPLDLASLLPGSTVTLSVQNGGAAGGFLNAWVDWSRNFSWADAGEQIATNLPIGAATTGSVTITVPATMTPGPVYFRFRIASTAGLTPVGPAQNGEVEDYAVKVRELPTQAIDYGDAPSKTQFGTSFPTLVSENGAGHNFASQQPILGTLRDGEADGVPTGNALGDDLATSDDEDGVFDAAGNPLNTTLLYGGQLNKIVVNVGGSVPGYLNAWVDANQDGDWDDAGEHFVVDDLVTGIQNYDINLPAMSGRTTLRFRVSTEQGLDYSGLAKNGEVEDYVVAVKDLSGPVTHGTGILYRSGQGVAVLFDEAIDGSSLKPDDLVATHEKSGQKFTPSSVTFDPETNVATFMFHTLAAAGAGGAVLPALPDGNYTFVLEENAVEDAEGNANPAAEISQGGEFFFLTGDANHDRAVNFDDLLIVAQNYGQEHFGYDQGDFNLSGNVDFDDLLTLSQNYGATLPAMAAGSELAKPAAATKRREARTAAVGL